MKQRRVPTTEGRSQIRGTDLILAAEFVNALMSDGKRAVAQRVFDQAMDRIRKRMKGKNATDVFAQAVENAKSLIEVRSKRVGGATYQVPMQVNSRRQQTLAVRWLIGTARD